MINLSPKYLVLLFLICIVLNVFFKAPPIVNAETSLNNSYILNLQEQTNTKSQQIEEITPTITPSPAPSYSITAANPNSLSISSSQSLVDYGIISPTNPILRDNTIKVYSNSSYSLFAYQSGQLFDTVSQSSIPDTTCDNGDCNSFHASLWTSGLAYGFGYRCDMENKAPCGNEFSQNSFFKPFSANDLTNTLIIQSGTKGFNARITYKVNASATQPHGEYENTITFMAMPNL